MSRGILCTFLTALPLALFGDAFEGQQLEQQLWADIKESNWPIVEQKIAQSFQSIHEDGPRNRAEELELLKELNLGRYRLSNFQVTEGPGTYIVSYTVTTIENLDGKPINEDATYRLSVWQQIGNTWQWISHANLTPIPGD